MSTLLVTGGAGFIGANFVHYWMKNYSNDKVIVLDALTYAGNLENLDSLRGNSNFVFVEGDIRNQDLVEHLLRSYRVGTLIHFAAESHVDRSILGPDAFIDTNILGTHALLKAARKVWLDEGACAEHRFHHVSTDEVYGTLQLIDPAFSESTPYAPNSPYAASKAASDHLVRAYHHTYGLEITTSNCSNNYGPYHFPEKLIPLCITNVLRGKSLPVYGNGHNVRDWLFVEDHCRGIDQILRLGKVGETYNIGGINEWKNIDIVNKICDLIDGFSVSEPGLAERYPAAPFANGQKCNSLITFVEDRLGHDFRYAINPKKIVDELEFEPSETFESGILKTIQWYLEHDSWWRRLIDSRH